MAAIAVLKPRVVNGRVLATLTLRNVTSGDTLQVEPRQLFREGGSAANVVELVCEGKTVPYQGRMEKRAAALPEQMILVRPGESVSGEADLTSQFAFLLGQHTYTVRYQAFVVDMTKDTLVEVRSDHETFVLNR